MRPEQWQVFRNAAKRVPAVETPVAAIVDSPWIPGYVGVSHLEYFVNPDVWFEANLKVVRDFPDVIFFPSWWVEYGMAIEPSAFGNRLHFYPDRTPDQSATLLRLEDVGSLLPVNPRTDGFMPFALERYTMSRKRVEQAGYTIPVVAARGPLCIASFLRGLTTFLMDIADGREEVQALLRLTTACVIDWLKAQAEAIGDSVQGILVLDDIAGMLSRRTYLEFAHPWLKQICEAFPADWVKVYHNDANVRPFLQDLPDTGFDVLNWSHKVPVREAVEKTQGRMCLMGNLPPLEVAVNGTPEMVAETARAVIAGAEGASLILSLGGGVSPGMPAANLAAMAAAARNPAGATIA